MEQSRELIEKAFDGVRPRRTPIFDLLYNDAVIEHFANFALDGTNDRKVVKDAAANALDGTRCIAVPQRRQDTWLDPAGNIRMSDCWTSWLKTPAFSNVDGWAGWLRQYIEGFEAGPEKTIQLDLTEVRSDSDRCKTVLAEQQLYNQAIKRTVNLHCTPSTAINAILYYMGLDMFSYLWTDYRDLLIRWMGVYKKLTMNYVDICAHNDTSPAVMIYADIAYKNGSMFSRDMFKQMGFFEEVAEICFFCHKKDLKVIFHSDGYIMGLIDDLIATGIDGLNPIEKAAGMDIFELRRKYPNLTFVGGVDVTHLLRTASVDDIHHETRRIITEVGSEGHLIIGSSTEVGNDVPLENYLACHDEAMAD